jgi:hypothetical protein
MPSTYTGSGIELIGDGEQSGSWGNTTNNNLEIINRLVSEAGTITLAGTTHTLSIADGTLSDGQYAVLVFGGAPSGTNTVTLSPNDAKRVFIVKNDSGESVVLTQGSGGNVTVGDGKTAIVYSDGAGSGAAVVNVSEDFVSATLSAIGALTPTDGNFIVGNGTTWVAETGNTVLNSIGVTATTTELNVLDGITASTAELNFVDGVTANIQTQLDVKAAVTTSISAGTGLTGGGTLEANRTISHADTSSQASVDNTGTAVIQDVTLDDFGHVTALGSKTLALTDFGVTATSAELNIMDGVTATTAELNILEGVTATTAELNILDGVTATTAELNILSGVTATAAELNILDGVTATTAELNILDGVTATATEINTLDGIPLLAGNGGKAVVVNPGGTALDYQAFPEGTVYTAGTGLTLVSSTIFTHADTSSQASVDNSGATVIQDVTLDDFGHVTALASATLALSTFGVTATAAELNFVDGVTSNIQTQLNAKAATSTSISAGAGLTGGGDLSASRTISHADTSSQSSVDNSGNTFVQDITLDTYGHVTGLTSAAVSFPDPTTNQVATATAGIAVGAVGSYAFLGETSFGATTNPGGTQAGSGLRYANVVKTGGQFPGSWNDSSLQVANAIGGSSAPSGTWRAMGYNYGDFSGNYGATLWLRIS